MHGGRISLMIPAVILRAVMQTVGFVAASMMASAASPGLPETPLTTIREIRSLTPEQAATAIPVHLKGTVTFSKPSISTLFIHDGSGGVFVLPPNSPDDSGPKVGDRVEVTGVTGAGLFATVVNPPRGQAPDIRVTGHGSPPEPTETNARTLMVPEMDCEWVAISAFVKEVSMESGDLVLSCQEGTHEFGVLLEGPLPVESVPWNLAESRARIRGIVATRFNPSRQMTGRLLRVSSLADIEPIGPSEPQQADPPLVNTSSLLRAGGIGPDDLVKVRGITTMAISGRGLFLQVEDGGLWVQTAQPVAAVPGTVIEVTGWPRPGEMKPYLRARNASVIGTTTLPVPENLEAADLLKAEKDGHWVVTDAELLDSYQGPEGVNLELRNANLVFRGNVASAPAGWEESLRPGSTLRVRGVVRISSTGNMILRVEDKLTLLSASAADITMIAPPPFWTPRRIGFASAFLFLGGTALFGVARTRRIREQETQRREFEAVLAERGRFAREIHDSLAQGLTSISLQLECARDNLNDQPEQAASHIENARSLVRDSLREARRTIWNLRPLALGEADLASSLQRFASSLNSDGRIACSQQIEGTPRPLPQDHEATLLRIGQEALTNAVRHSGATEIRQHLRYGNGWITLTVKDNGRGFDVADMARSGFGLTGMRERAAGLGGSLSIDSRSNHGTEVSATLPT